MLAIKALFIYYSNKVKIIKEVVKVVARNKSSSKKVIVLLLN